MSDPEVLKAIVAAGSSVCVALLALMGTVLTLLLQTRRHAKRADEQVSNNHDTNLREEADERHDENRRSLISLSRQLDEMAGSVRGIQRDVGRLWDTDLDHQNRIHELEQTRPKVSPDYDEHTYPRRRDLREARRP